MAVVRRWFSFPMLVIVAAGCSSELEQHPNLVSDREGETSKDARDTSFTTVDAGTPRGTAAGSCDVSASWGARADFRVESAKGRLGDVLETLVRASGVSPIAVSSHVDANCLWSVAFSAPDDGAAGPRHAAAFAPMQRHPAGLWTAAPQTSGWLRVIDAASNTVWIPLAFATGSANYGDPTCGSLSDVHVSALIPAAAGALTLATSEGARTLQSLLDAPSGPGWDVRFTFSADTTR